MHFCTLHFVCRPEDQDIKAAIKLLNSHQADFDPLEVSDRILAARLVFPTMVKLLTKTIICRSFTKMLGVPPDSDFTYFFCTGLPLCYQIIERHQKLNV